MAPRRSEDRELQPPLRGRHAQRRRRRIEGYDGFGTLIRFNQSFYVIKVPVLQVGRNMLLIARVPNNCCSKYQIVDILLYKSINIHVRMDNMCTAENLVWCQI